jgi:adenine phosphoribosyltransferase
MPEILEKPVLSWELRMSVGSIDFGDYVASYPDFPKAGILFRDISPLLASAEGMAQAIDQFAAQLSGFDIDLIAGIESRGFLFSTLLASRLNIGSMMVRKPARCAHPRTVGSDH